MGIEVYSHYDVVDGGGSKGGRYWGTLGSLGEDQEELGYLPP